MYYSYLARIDGLKLKCLHDEFFLQTCKLSLHKTLIDGLESRFLANY